MLSLGEPRAEEISGTNFRRYRAEMAFSSVEYTTQLLWATVTSMAPFANPRRLQRVIESCWFPPGGLSGCILSCAWHMLHTGINMRQTPSLRWKSMRLECLHGRSERVLRCLRMKLACSAPHIWRTCQICWHNWARALPFLTRQVDVHSASSNSSSLATRPLPISRFGLTTA